MHISKVENYDKKRKLICIDGCEPFLLYHGDIRKFGIIENAYISEALYEEIINGLLAKRAFQRCIYLLEKRDYTERQIKDKLSQAMYPTGAIQYAIEKCKGYGYVDDERYAVRYMECYVSKKSLRAIKQELFKKGIPRDYIDLAEGKVLEDGKQDVSVMIQNILRKRHFYESEKDSKEMAKQYKYLLSKGFMPSDISRELKLDITN